jgi:methionyl-tRNA formyltransferase
MRLVFFGSADFAVPALEAIADHVVLVVSQPDQPTGRGMRMRSTPVKRRAQELGLEVLTPDTCRDPEFIARIEAIKPDVNVVAAYGQIMPVRLLNAAAQGSVNLHGSILPRWRGAAPIQRAVAAGDKETGVTLMQMAKGMDTGDILAIESTDIGPEETAGELFDRLAVMAGQMAAKWLPKIAGGGVERIPQDEALATHAAKMTKADGLIEFTMTAEDAHRRHRGATPFPGSSLITSAGRIKVKRARLMPNCAAGPGCIESVNPDLVVGFSEGGIALIEVQPEGRKPVSGSDFANGARLKPGDGLNPLEDTSTHD